MVKEERNIVDVDKKLFEIIEKLIKDFEEKHGIRLSQKQATKIIGEKILAYGGIKKV